ncbi:MAG: nucleotidyltransferase domain-containing protein [Desulfohalobiaceae bacterium]
MLDCEYIESIKQECQKHQEILAAYIFGSRARGQAGAGSDLDLAVLLYEQAGQDFDYLELKVALERLLDQEVDLIVLNNSEEPLKHQVRRDGRIIFDRDPEKRKHWEIMSRKFYQDFLHLHRIYMQGMRRALGVSADGQ